MIEVRERGRIRHQKSVIFFRSVTRARTCVFFSVIRFLPSSRYTLLSLSVSIALMCGKAAFTSSFMLCISRNCSRRTRSSMKPSASGVSFSFRTEGRFGERARCRMESRIRRVLRRASDLATSELRAGRPAARVRIANDMEAIATDVAASALFRADKYLREAGALGEIAFFKDGGSRCCKCSCCQFGIDLRRFQIRTIKLENFSIGNSITLSCWSVRATPSSFVFATSWQVKCRMWIDNLFDSKHDWNRNCLFWYFDWRICSRRRIIKLFSFSHTHIIVVVFVVQEGGWHATPGDCLCLPGVYGLWTDAAEICQLSHGCDFVCVEREHDLLRSISHLRS